MGKRKSRWNDEKVVIDGMPTILPDNLTPKQEKLYLLQLQIEELSQRLRTNDLKIPPEGERSPSPEPVYNNDGKRLNTREVRAQKKIEKDRHFFIQKMLLENPTYKPPSDYRPPTIIVREKVLIPQEDFPDINFVGLLIGPRGHTHRSIEQDSGTRMIIRGKGSVKEGKSNRTDGQPAADETEPLHALVSGTTEEQVAIAVNRIKEIVRQAIEVPENKNDLRRTQLRHLAMLNGTLRENDSRCNNCGSSTHKSWQCPEKPNITNRICCSNCGGVGHLLRDCKEPRRSLLNPGGTFEPGSSALTSDRLDLDSSRSRGQSGDAIDEDYEKFMAELGES